MEVRAAMNYLLRNHSFTFKYHFMRNKLTFTIETLLHGIENVRGPIEQVNFARNFADYQKIPRLNQLVRIKFRDGAGHRSFPGAVPLEDTLIIGCDSYVERTHYICVMAENSGLYVAKGHYPDRRIKIQKDYRDALILDKLSDEDIQEIFNYIWDHPDEMQPSSTPWTDDME